MDVEDVIAEVNALSHDELAACLLRLASVQDNIRAMLARAETDPALMARLRVPFPPAVAAKLKADLAAIDALYNG